MTYKICSFSSQIDSVNLVSAGYTRHQSCSRIVILQSIDNTIDPVDRSQIIFLWGRNGFDGDKEASAACQAPVGL